MLRVLSQVLCLKTTCVLVMSNFIFANYRFCIQMFLKTTGAILFKFIVCTGIGYKMIALIVKTFTGMSS